MAKDAYSRWLDLPDGPRPPKAHELLGVPAQTRDRQVIDQAAADRMDQLDRFVLSGDRATRQEVQQLMNEVAKARTAMVRRLPAAKPMQEAAATAPPTQAAPPLVATPTHRGVNPPTPVVQSVSFSNRAAVLFKSAMGFWALIASVWAVSLVAVFAVTYYIAKPDPPVPPRSASLESPIASVPDETSAPPIQAAEQPLTPTDDDVVAEDVEQPIQPEPAGPTEEERLVQQQADQQRLAREQAKAEQDRLTLEQQRLEEARLEAERLRLEQIKQQEADRLAAEAAKEQEQRKLKALQTYLVKRDRLSGPAQLELIRQMLSEVNGGIDVKINATYAGDRIDSIDLGVWTDRQNRKDANAKITDLSPLMGLKPKELNLGHLSSLTNLDALAGMPLERLSFEDAHGLTDISALKGMPMTYLKITEAPIPDLESLRGMPLEHLFMIQCNNIKSTGPLTGIKLRSVHFNVCENLTDLTGLEQLDSTGIVSSFYRAGITDLTPLKGAKFGQLTLSKCDQLASLKGLEGAPFRDLVMTDMALIDDLTPIKDIRITGRLEIGGPRITDLSPIARLSATRLQIKAENLKSLKGVESMPKLEQVSIYGSPGITKEEVAKLKRARPDLQIQHR